MSDNAVRREISSFMLSYLGVSPRTPQTIEPSRALVLTYIKLNACKYEAVFCNRAAATVCQLSRPIVAAPPKQRSAR